MCGIAGYSLSTNGGKTDSVFLANAESQLLHRGPDDTGTFIDAEVGVGLVHTRLSILDTSPMGHQPMVSADGKVALILNGEIYNYKELRLSLEEQGCQFNGNSDTEVLLRSYLNHRDSEFGIENLLRKLNGIFAFAIWDADMGDVLLARDAFGVKPLYFTTSTKGFYFASEIKALSPLTRTIDMPSIHRYLSYLWCPGDGTPIKEVRKVCPGEALWVKGGRIMKKMKWFQLPAFHKKKISNSPKNIWNIRSAAQSLEEHLRSAVHRQMVSDVPVGAFLSGGLDSSSIVALASEIKPDIQCFTISLGGAEDGMASDLPYAQRVAKHLNVPLDIIQVDAKDMANDLPAMVAQIDEPLADPAPLNVLYISQVARRQGIKVLLSGAGGDDLLTGYRRHQALLFEPYWDWLPPASRKWLSQAAASLDQRKSIGRRLRKLFNGAALDGDQRLVNYFIWNDREDLLALYTPEFAEAVADIETAAPMHDFLANLPAGTSSLDRMLSLEQRFFLADHNLTYTDKMSMMAGVEVRVPFLDLDLVEFAASVPDNFKQHGREGKWILKKAMEPYLPRDIIYREKTGFGAPLRHWIRFELRDFLNDVLSESNLRRRGLFDAAAVQKLIANNDAGFVDASYTIFSLLCIELWCQKFLDQDIVL